MRKFKESVYENSYLSYYVKNKDESKNIGSGSSKKIEWKCPNCGYEYLNTPYKVKTRGFKCKVCSGSRSYSERLMFNLLVEDKIPFEEQKKFDGCKYKSQLPFDFYLTEHNICIEMQGIQHYDKRKNSGWYEERMEVSDDIKREFCKNNNITYIDINCSSSDFYLIIKNIKKTVLNNLLTFRNLEKIKIKSLERNEYTDIDKITRLHNDGISFLEIQKITGVDRKKIVRILKKIGEYNPRGGDKNNGKKVVCINDQKVFDTLTDARDFANLKQVNNIMMACKGKRKTAGKHPLTGEPLKWMYYDEYLNQT